TAHEESNRRSQALATRHHCAVDRVFTQGVSAYSKYFLSPQAALELVATGILNRVNSTKIIPSATTFLDHFDRPPLQQISSLARQTLITSCREQEDSTFTNCGDHK